MNGKRSSSQQVGPLPKRGPISDFDDLIEEELAGDDAEAAFLPDDLDEEDPELGEAGRNWLRPPVPAMDAAKDSLVFQQLEVDYCLQRPRQDVWPTRAQQVPVVRMYGVNDAGNSVCMFVHGFEPYFYCDCPSGWGPEDCQELCTALRDHPRLKDKGPGVPPVVGVELVQKTNLWGYQGGQSRPYLKVVCALPNLVAPARGALEDGVRCGERALPSLASYESNVLYALRFMVDTNMGGGQWLDIPAGRWKAATGPEGGAGRASWCQVEAHCIWNDIVAHAPEGEWSRIAPLRILSFDIECAGRKGHFPEATQDPVIQIASMVTVLGESKPRVKNILTLGSCAAIVGAEVMSFESEAEMLKRWTSLVLETDPDIITGYNINNFDLPYLFDRAKALRVEGDAHQWGRIRHSRVRMRDTTFSSKAYGTHEYKDLTIEGRVQFDVYMALQRDHKLSSYTLNAVSAHFLGEQKEDVHHSAISDLQNGNAETRRRLAVYCLKVRSTPAPFASVLPVKCTAYRQQQPASSA
eukprot:GHRQ01013012.1.p1 GENE.GHRQ01013012.1~~GHRQ01013012.1.p1  ORF type:complete len:524 (+),score=217.75 GHRQ01013012.1:79-1650(+)